MLCGLVSFSVKIQKILLETIQVLEKGENIVIIHSCRLILSITNGMPKFHSFQGLGRVTWIFLSHDHHITSSHARIGSA